MVQVVTQLKTLTNSSRIMSVGLNSSLLFADKKRDKKEKAEEKKRGGREGEKNP